MVSPLRHYLHPLCYSFAHAIHRLQASHGFSTPYPETLGDDFKKEAQQLVFESKFFNFLRRADRRFIATLDVNKHFECRYSQVQQVDARLDARLSLKAEDVVAIEKLNVCWRDNVDQHIHVNVNDHERCCGAI